MTTMLSVGSSELGRFTSGSPLRVKQSFWRGQAFSSSVRTTCSSSGVRSSANSWRLVQDVSKQLKTGAERLMQNTKESEVGRALAPIAASAALCVQVAGPAFADVAEAAPVEDESSYWFWVLVTSGAAGFVYLLVIPLIIYNYLRLRWYKRSALETYFQFMLVFVFFPGLLLLAPFINFRRLPKEGTEAP